MQSSRKLGCVEADSDELLALMSLCLSVYLCLWGRYKRGGSGAASSTRIQLSKWSYLTLSGFTNSRRQQDSFKLKKLISGSRALFTPRCNLCRECDLCHRPRHTLISYMQKCTRDASSCLPLLLSFLLFALFFSIANLQRACIL